RVPRRKPVVRAKPGFGDHLLLHAPDPADDSVMSGPGEIIYIVDDDAPIRVALIDLLESPGLRAVGFGSAGDYVEAPKPDLPACLILDVELPDINGLDLQKQIADGEHPPIIFITGHGDIPSS